MDPHPGSADAVDPRVEAAVASREVDQLVREDRAQLGRRQELEQWQPEYQVTPIRTEHAEPRDQRHRRVDVALDEDDVQMPGLELGSDLLDEREELRRVGRLELQAVRTGEAHPKGPDDQGDHEQERRQELRLSHPDARLARADGDGDRGDADRDRDGGE